jgi:hypothetical protein
LFLLAILNLIAVRLYPVAPNGGPMGFLNNWLVVLFQMNAGFSGVHADRLRVLNLLDLVVLALVAATHLGLHAALRRTSRIGSTLALIQPFLGIALFLATKTAGRSSVMGAGLVISAVMLYSETFGKVTAGVGIMASVLLLIGDFATTADSPSNPLAILIASGYLLLMAWFFLVGRKLLLLGRLERKAFPPQNAGKEE